MDKKVNVEFKAYFYERKPNWEIMPITELVERINKIPSNNLESGNDAIYLKPYVLDQDGKKQFWPIMDVESKEHDNVALNLEEAKDLYIWLSENNLDDNLTIFLTGRGTHFVWPYRVPEEYSKAFKMWIMDKKHFACIDPNPHLKNSFVRVAGYRGNRRQGSPMDVHVHKLPDSKMILDLDESKYKKLVSGSVGADYIRSCIGNILPDQNITNAFVRLFDYYQRQHNLRGSILAPSFPKRVINNESVRSQVEEHLSAMAIDFREYQTGHGEIIKLSVCPICGRKDGNAYVTSAGRLKCWHANSCEAGEIRTEGGIAGLSPDKWIPNFEYSNWYGSPSADKNITPLDSARARIALNDKWSKKDLLVTATPGVGKTTITLSESISTCHDKKILYISPTKKLNTEIYSHAKQVAAKHDIDVFLLRGRDEEMCPKHKDVEKITRRGFSPSAILCPTCYFRRNRQCQYLDQMKALKSPGFFITTHAQSLYLDLKKHKFDVVIVDENPTKTFIIKGVAKLDQILRLKVGMGPNAQSFFEKMLKTIALKQQLLSEQTQKPGIHDRLYITEPPVGSHWENCAGFYDQTMITEQEKDAVLRDVYAYLQLPNEKHHKWQRRLYKSGVSLIALQWILAALGKRLDLAYLKISLDTNRPVEFVQVKKMLPKFSGRLIVLDGTGDLAEVEALFKRKFKHVDANVELKDFKKIFLHQSLGKWKSKKLNPSKQLKLLEQATSHLSFSDRKILVVTHKDIETKVLFDLQGLLPGRIVETTHFFANRGLNEFKDYDAVIAFGTPTANPAGVLDDGMLLFKDPDEVQRFIGRIGDTDLAQSVHRVRPVNGGKKLILIGRDWPAEYFGAPDVFINLRRGEHAGFEEAYDRIWAFTDTFRFITKEVAWTLGLGANRELEYLKSYKTAVLKGLGCEPSQITVPCLIKGILDKEQFFQGGINESWQVIIFGRPSTWNDLLNQLRMDFPELPELQIKSRKTGGHWTQGLGAISMVNGFYEVIGIPLLEESRQGSYEEITDPMFPDLQAINNKSILDSYSKLSGDSFEENYPDFKRYVSL